MKHLGILIFQLLLEKPHTGYSLAKEIEAKTDWKPSWGSIYPTLEHLEQEKLVTVQEKGRSKVYTLTKKGVEAAKERVNKSQELIGEIVERMKVMQTLTGEDMSLPIAFLSEHIKGNNPFLPIQQRSMAFRGELFRLWQHKLIKDNAKTINTVLKDAAQQLRNIQ